MRIMYLNHNVAGSGTYQRALHVALEAVRRGHEATLVTTSRARMLRSDVRECGGVRVVEAPDLLAGGARNGWDAWNTLWRTSHLVRRGGFDLIHAFDARPVVIVPALAVRLATGAPLVLDWADWWGRGGVIAERSGWPVRTFFGPVETWFEEAFRTGAAANTVISDRLRERCELLGVPRERILTMPNGCEPPRAGLRERATARGALGLAEDIPLLVHIGAMHRADGNLLAGAFRLARQRLPDARLVLLGSSRGAPALRAEQGVIHTGYVAAEVLWRWLAAADAGVIVMRDNIASHARWPGKINDYFTAGLPVVMPHVGAAAEYVERFDVGRTAAPTAESFGAAMADLLNDREKRHRQAVNAAELAGGALSWSSVTRRLFEFYDRWGARSEPRDGRHESMAGVS